MLLETACDLVAIAKDPKADVNEAERAFKNFYSNLFAYGSEFRNNRKQAMESWIAFNQNQNSLTTLEQVLEFAEQIKYAVAPDPGHLPGHHPGRLTLGPSGPGRKQIVRFTENWPFISKGLRRMNLLDRTKLERKLHQELVRARRIARLNEGALAAALISGAAQSPPNESDPSRKPKASKIAAAIGVLSQHPEWTNKEIASAVGCNPKYLSQQPSFKAARKAIRGIGLESYARSRRYRGRDMDAYTDDHEKG